MRQKKIMKTLYTATTRIWNYLYRTNHTSNGANDFTESCHTYEESTVNFSDFMEQYVEHEKKYKFY